ncbi:MAG: hypothetical protein JXA60_09170 [Candidatus Coatesbacteria bacterium]|nr:hypothetical protein [Candidatus Coatesbacteria bacterium]
MFLVIAFSASFLTYYFSTGLVHELSVIVDYNRTIRSKMDESSIILMLLERLKSRQMISELPAEMKINENNIMSYIGWEIMERDENSTKLKLKIITKDRNFIERNGKQIIEKVVRNYNEWFMLRHESRKASIEDQYNEIYFNYSAKLENFLYPLLERNPGRQELLDSLIQKQTADSNIVVFLADFYKKQHFYISYNKMPAEVFYYKHSDIKKRIAGKGRKQNIIILLTIIFSALIFNGFMKYFDIKRDRGNRNV